MERREKCSRNGGGGGVGGGSHGFVYKPLKKHTAVIACLPACVLNLCFLGQPLRELFLLGGCEVMKL